MITQTTVWEKIFAKQIPDKGIIFRIYKELPKLNKNQISIFKKKGYIFE